MGTIKGHRQKITQADSVRINTAEWDRYADEYQATHGDFLGDAGFLWGPEGVREDDLGALGDVRGKAVLELGSGAGQCARWAAQRGAQAIGLDVSHRQLQHSRRLDEATGTHVPAVLASASALPFVDGSFDVVFSAFGALQFISDSDQLCVDIARVLRPRGRLAFSITHPTRWSFPDDPGEAGLTATESYWDRTPYVEVDEHTGEALYAEHHRTLGDWVRSLANAGFVIRDLIEPEWPPEHDRDWGGWGRTRGLLTPGTALFVADLLATEPPGQPSR